jgi:hypothetical protein
MGINGTSGQLYKCMPHHTEYIYTVRVHTHNKPAHNNNLYMHAVKLFFLLLFRVSPRGGGSDGLGGELK